PITEPSMPVLRSSHRRLVLVGILLASLLFLPLVSNPPRSCPSPGDLAPDGFRSQLVDQAGYDHIPDPPPRFPNVEPGPEHLRGVEWDAPLPRRYLEEEREHRSALSLGCSGAVVGDTAVDEAVEMCGGDALNMSAPAGKFFDHLRKGVMAEDDVRKMDWKDLMLLYKAFLKGPGKVLMRSVMLFITNDSDSCDYKGAARPVRKLMVGGLRNLPRRRDATSSGLLNITTVPVPTPLSPNSSSIHCATLSWRGQTACLTTNLVLNLTMLPISTPQFPHPPAGAAQVACSPNLGQLYHFPTLFGSSGASGYMRSAIEPVQGDSMRCERWVENDVYFLRRWDVTNPYQAHQDFLTLFATFSALRLDPRNVTIILLDTMPLDTPYHLALTSIFSRSPVRRMSDFGDAGTLCFRRAVWGPHGGASPLSEEARQPSKGCGANPMLLAFRRFMVDGWRRLAMGQQAGVFAELDADVVARRMPFEHAEGWRLDDAGRGPVVITYALRRASTRGTKASLKRVVENEAAVVAALRVAVSGWDGVEFRAVDFATMGIVEQVAVAQDTDVLVGPHGASFIHMLYGRRWPVGGVVELQPPERSAANFQFRNLAYALNHRFKVLQIGSRRVSNIREVVRTVKEVSHEVQRARRAMYEARAQGLSYDIPASDQHV
ncbi:hypothetical protein HK101_003270, partial [Irineochytrium annulatum]